MKYNFSGFTSKANEALNAAILSAENLGHTYIGSEHLLLGLLKIGSGVAFAVLQKEGVEADKIEDLIITEIGKGTPTKLSPDYFTPRAKGVIETAMSGCANMGKKFVGTEHLLIGILSESDNYAIRFLNALGIDLARLTNSALQSSGIELNESNTFEEKSKKEKTEKLKNLEKFGIDLTGEAQKGNLDPCIGRENEIERVVQILCRRTKNNPCLIGEPGVGKTAVIEGIAQKIASGEVPDILRNKRLFTLNLTSMVAGTKYRGDFEERIKSIIDEVTTCKNVILFIDEVHTIIGAGSAEGATDAANILKPALARGEFQLIGATTISEYRKNIEKDSALERRFQPVTVNEPTQEDAILILKGLRDKYEAHHNVKITDEAIASAVNLSSRYITDRFLPDKAIDLIDEAASKIRLKASKISPEMRQIEEEIANLDEEKTAAINSQDFEKAAKLRDKEIELKEKLQKENEDFATKNSHFVGEVSTQDIAEIVCSWTGIPVKELDKQESERLLALENELHKRLIGQDDAVKAVAKAIRRGRVGLKDPKRPIGSFIFSGPTGVGKTELCKALAEAMFGSEDMMIRLDMSEYMEKHTVSRLVGSPPGYVGFEEGGQLTEKVRRHPYSVVLFDEIEKAHPDVFNMLLQILEDGILTDSQGRQVDFKNTVIIMTSNVGARKLTERKTSFGFITDEKTENENIKDSVIGELKNTFRPEFLNRIDDIIVFTKLTRQEIIKIAENMLSNLSARLLNMDIKITFDKSVTEQLAEIGFDENYGARPLRREIQSKIEDTLSEKILEGSIKANDNVNCKFDGKEFVFEN